MDIGSNSVRQVIYEGLSRAPAVLFNEKVLCGLGKGIEATHRLNDEGVERAPKRRPAGQAAPAQPMRQHLA